jgi:hypothetical protein
MADSFVIVYYVPPAPIATRYNLYFKTAQDQSSGATSTVVGTHFIAQPWPIKHQVLSLLRQNPAPNVGPIVQPETNVHFLGRFVAPA